MRQLVRAGMLAGIVTIGGLALAGCGSGGTTLTLTQVPDDVQLTALDLNPAGDVGDVTAFEAPVLKDGEVFGSMMGTMTKVGSIGDGWNTEREERMLTAVFDLPDGQISVIGVSYYKEDDTRLPTSEPVTRAIVGGTGAYIGVDGEVETVRNEDGSYTHTIRIE